MLEWIHLSKGSSDSKALKLSRKYISKNTNIFLGNIVENGDIDDVHTLLSNMLEQNVNEAKDKDVHDVEVNANDILFFFQKRYTLVYYLRNVHIENRRRHFISPLL